MLLLVVLVVFLSPGEDSDAGVAPDGVSVVSRFWRAGLVGTDVGRGGGADLKTRGSGSLDSARLVSANASPT